MKVKSVVDVITNSSSEVFIAKTGNQELIERFAKELGFNLSPFSMSEYEAYLKHRKEKEKIREEKWNEYTEGKITYDEYLEFEYNSDYEDIPRAWEIARLVYQNVPDPENKNRKYYETILNQLGEPYELEESEMIVDSGESLGMYYKLIKPEDFDQYLIDFRVFLEEYIAETATSWNGKGYHPLLTRFEDYKNPGTYKITEHGLNHLGYYLAEDKKIKKWIDDNIDRIPGDITTLATIHQNIPLTPKLCEGYLFDTFEDDCVSNGFWDKFEKLCNELDDCGSWRTS